MIRLTTDTKVNKKDETVDNSIYITKIDDRNMGLVKLLPSINKKTGKQNVNVLGYYSNFRTLLKHSIDFVIKSGSEPSSLQEMAIRIDEYIARIDEICSDMPSMVKMIKESK